MYVPSEHLLWVLTSPITMHSGSQQTVCWQASSSCPAHAMRQLETAVLQGLGRTQSLAAHRRCAVPVAHAMAAHQQQQRSGIPDNQWLPPKCTNPNSWSRSRGDSSSSRCGSCIVALVSRQDADTTQAAQRYGGARQPHHWRRGKASWQQQQQQQQSGLEQLLQVHLHTGQQQQQQAAAAGRVKLERKLTAVLRDSTSSAADVADVLLVADSCCCLNAIHIAAALARLVRLAQAQEAADTAAAAAAGDAEGYSAGYTVTAVVPLSEQQGWQMRLVRSAAAVAAAADAAAACRWHVAPLSPVSSPATATDAGWCAAAQQCGEDDGEAVDSQQQQQQYLVEQLAAAAVELWPTMAAPTVTSVCWSLAVLEYEPPAQLLRLAGAALAGMASSLQQQQPSSAVYAGTEPAAAAADAQAHVGAQQQQQQQQVPGQLPPGHHQDLPGSPRQVTILMWALARITTDIDDILPQQQQEQEQGCKQQSGDLDTDNSSLASSSRSGQLLQNVLLRLAPHVPDLSSQGLLLLLWAAGTWAKSSSSSSSSDMLQFVSVPSSEALLSATASAIESQALIPRGLAVAVWSAARLGLSPDPAWLGAWFAAMHEVLPAAGPQDLVTAAWGLAHMGCPPPADWLSAFSRRACAVAPYMSARELPALLWAFARLRYRPPAHATHALLQQGGRLASQGALSPQGLALLLHCCGVLGIELPGRWLDGVLAVAAGFLPLFRPVEGSMLWVALVKLQHIPPAAWLDVWWAGSKGLLSGAGGQQLVLMLWSAVKLGQGPPSHWMRDWLAASHEAMSRGNVTAQGFGLMWDALAQIAPTGPIPSTDWLACYFTASCQPSVLARLDPLVVDRTLSGLAAVGQQLQQGLDLPQDWTGSMLAASVHVLPSANLVSVSNMLQAAGQLALPLPPVWLAAAMARLQQLMGHAGVLVPSVRSSSSSLEGDSAASSSGSARAAGRKHVRSFRASTNSSAGSGRSMVLSARLERGFIKLCLQRVLFGLRAQQMMNSAAQRKMWYAAQQAAAGTPCATAEAAVTAAAAAALEGGAPDEAGVSGAAGRSDVLAVWPWLTPAVHAVWPSKQSAQLVLHTLLMR